MGKRIGFLTDYTPEDLVGGAGLSNQKISEYLQRFGYAVSFLKVNERVDDWNRIWSENFDFLIVANVPHVSQDRLYSIITGKIPYIVIRHDVPSVAYQAEPSAHPAAKIIQDFLGNSVFNVFVSPIQLEWYKKIGEVRNSLVLPPPADISRFVMNAAKNEKREGILYLGDISECRGIEDSIAYAEKVFPGERIHFHGRIVSDKYALHINASGHAIFPSVGYHDVPELMRRYKHFVYHPRIIDAFCLKVLEAELSGMVLHCRESNIGRFYYSMSANELLQFVEAKSCAVLCESIGNLIR